MKKFSLIASLFIFVFTLTACVPKNPEVFWEGLTKETIEVGTPFDLMEGVSAKAGTLDSAVRTPITTSNIFVYDDDDFSSDIPGVYEVTYAIRQDDVPDWLGEDDGYFFATRTITVTDANPVILIDFELEVQLNDDSFDLLAGISAEDPQDGILPSSQVVIEGTVDVTEPGEYPITVTATDSEGNVTTTTFTITVVSNESPTFTGLENQTITVGGSFDPLEGVTANDLEDGDLTESISISGTFDVNAVGDYTLTYQVTDSDGNLTEDSITLTVRGNTVPTITAPDEITIFQGDLDGFLAALEQIVATDAEDGDLTKQMSDGALEEITAINLLEVGDYPITLKVTDSDGNEVTQSLLVRVIADNAPVITVDETITVSVDSVYDLLDFATATDDKDGDLTSSINVSGDVLGNFPGSYTLTYEVTDSYGNTTSTDVTFIIEGLLTIEEYLSLLLTELSDSTTSTETLNIKVNDSLPQELIDFRETAFSGGVYGFEPVILSSELFDLYYVTFTLNSETYSTYLVAYEDEGTLEVSFVSDLTLELLASVHLEMSFLITAADGNETFMSLINQAFNNTIPVAYINLVNALNDGTYTLESYALDQSVEDPTLFTFTFVYGNDETGELVSEFVLYVDLIDHVVHVEFVDPNAPTDDEPTLAEIQTAFEAFLLAYHDGTETDLDLESYVLNAVPLDLLELRSEVLDGFATIQLVSITESLEVPGTFEVALELNTGMLSFPSNYTIYGVQDETGTNFGFVTNEEPVEEMPTLAEIQTAFEAFLLAYQDGLVTDLDLEGYVLNGVPLDLLDVRLGVVDGSVTITLISITESLEVPGTFEVTLELDDGLMVYPFNYMIFGLKDEIGTYFGFVPLDDGTILIPSIENLTVFIQNYLNDLGDMLVSDEDLNALASFTLPNELLDLRPALSSGALFIENLVITPSLEFDDEFIISFDVSDGVNVTSYTYTIWAYEQDTTINFGFVVDDTGFSVPTLVDLQSAVDAFLVAYQNGLVTDLDLELLISTTLPSDLATIRPSILDGTFTITGTPLVEDPIIYGDFTLTINYTDGVNDYTLDLWLWAEETDGVISFGFYSLEGDIPTSDFPTLNELTLELDNYFMFFEDPLFTDEDIDLYVLLTTPVDLLAMRADILSGTTTILGYSVLETATPGLYTLTISIDNGLEVLDYTYTLDALLIDGFVTFTFSAVL